MAKRSSFGSKFGMLAAAVGSAVGLGNIWKFPYVAGANGGGAFLLVYILCVILLGFPALITELTIGRAGDANPVSAFSSIRGNKRWNFVGVMGVLASFLTLGFYFVVAGWSLEYMWQTIATHSFSGMDIETLQSGFSQFSTASMRPYVWMVVFVIITGVIIYCGVQKGIEAGSKILMPLLFVVVLFLVIRAFFIPGGAEGYEFYLKPDFSKITASVVLQALGQAFFSLSIGFGIMLTYGSYMRQGNVVSTSLQICVLDTLIAFMAGLVIFPAVFAYGIEPTQGPTLAFITLPAVFSQMSGGVVFGTLFFFLLAVAALTSTISLYEAIVVTVSELCHISRRWAIVVIGILLILSSALCCHSLTADSPFVFGGMSLFDIFDKFTSNILLTLGGFFMAIFLGWVVPKERVRSTLMDFGMTPRLFPVYMFFVRFFVPLAVALIFLQQLGIL